jgi:subfamily B ATP-binding cassette protein MsbA
MTAIKILYDYFIVYQKYVGKKLITVFFLNFLAAFIEGFGIIMLMPMLLSLGTIVDEGAQNAVTETLQELLVWMGISESVVLVLLFIALVFLLKGLLLTFVSFYIADLRAILTNKMKIMLFDSYSTMSYEHYVKHNAGHFVNFVTLQTQKHADSFLTFKNVINIIVMVFVYLTISMIVEPIFTSIAIVIGGGSFFLFKKFTKKIRQISVDSVEMDTTVSKLVIQIFHGYKYLFSTGGVSVLRHELKHNIERLSEFQKNIGVMTGIVTSAREPLVVSVLLLIIGLQVIVFEGGVLSIMVALLLINRSISQILGLQQAWQSFMKCYGSLEKVEEELILLNQHKEKNGNIVLKRVDHEIEFRDISFSYGDISRSVINNVSFRVPSNHTVAIVGESGSGKSTLVDIMTLLLRPQQGVLQIDGVEGKNIDVASWRGQIGYISQDTVIFNDTIANNISMWSDDYKSSQETLEQIELAAGKAAALDFINDLPEGFQTIVGDNGVILSGGQRQRLFIARELFKKPKLLIMDEATSALDSKSEALIRETIDNLHGKMTVVMIAHRLATIKNADYILVMQNGEIVERGKYDDLLHNVNSVFSEMVSLQRL